MKKVEKVLIVALLFCSIINLTLAQSSKKQLLKGKKEFEQGNLKEAYNYFLDVLYQSPDNIEAKYYAGICHLESQSPKKALEYLKEVKKQTGDYYSELPYHLARAYYQNLKFEKAMAKLEQVSDHSEIAEQKARLKQMIHYAQDYYKAENHVIVKNLGPNVNTTNREYSTVISSDHKTILFTSKVSNLAKDESLSDDENIFTTIMDEETFEWNKPKPIKGMNSNGNDATIQLFDNDRKMVTYHKGDLHISEFENGVWQKGKGIKGINTPSYEAHCFIANEGNTIFFSSNYGTYDTDLDLYFSTKDKDGNWTEPKPLTNLNTRFDEDSPFLAEDGTLYFSSKGHTSMGGFDIFKTRYDSLLQQWEEPQNLGVPINSVFDDIFYVNYGKVAYFSSSRPGGYGGPDIYNSFLFDKVKMEGRLLEKQSQKPISNGKIQVKNANEVVYETVTNSHGKYELIIPIETEVEISIIKSSTLLHKEKYMVKVSFKDVNDNIYDFVLDVNKFGDELPTVNREIFSKTKSIRLSAINDWQENDILFSEDIPSKIEISVGDLALEKPLEDPPEHKKLNLPKLALGKSINLSLYFDNDNSIIKEQFYGELDRIGEFLLTQSDIIIEVAGHTDSNGSNEYNMKLSDQRAKAVALYLIEKGIDKSRIVAVGYGENFPLASNDDEVNGRELNRRVEIKRINQEYMNLTTKN
ncbi:OmpA family protein [Flexithrix dorotheae]|uniref:OmpA family protein n=1 Tax=Flexithrix dorotheae TaxID=70993 RepID=UPI0003636103|nr:OmpA family protein [Flexithrix dorotheae]